MRNLIISITIVGLQYIFTSDIAGILSFN